MGVNKYASTFPMASCNKERCYHRKKWRKKIRKYAIVFASTQLRITRLRKYPIDPKAYLGRWMIPLGMAEWCIPFWVTLTLTLTSGLISRFFLFGAYLLYYSLLSSNVSYARPIPLGAFVMCL